MRTHHFLLLLLSTAAWPATKGWPQDTRTVLPAIREVWLDAKDAPMVLGTGSWSIVPRPDFSNTLEAARKVSLAEKRKPWLMSALYDARIDGLQMSGTAQLLIHNPHPIAAWAQLSPWTMPLRHLGESINQKKLTAVRSSVDRTVALLTEPDCNQGFRLAWSTQGEERSDGRWFQLQLPACPQATMNIIVPLPYRLDWPSARQHLRGPFPIEGENARSWQLQLGGEFRQDVQLLLRAPLEQRQISWMEARLDADFVINGSEVVARYEVDAQRWHDRLRTLILEIPEPLKIKSLSLKQVDADLPLPFQKLSATTHSILLPESIEQRAQVVLEATWSIRQGERIVFHTPGIRNCQSLKPTLRIVSKPSEPLIEWNWGDFVPQQWASQDTTAEILTLIPHSIMGAALLTAPSARQVQRTLDLVYQQDSWWNVGRRKQQLSVRMQCTSTQGQNEYLSWQVPSGWKVKEVLSDPSTPLHAWNWHPGRPLEIQWPAGRKTGQKNLVTVQLEPDTPVSLTEEPRVWFMPSLIPLVPGRFNGTYAISLERTGELLPPSLVVIKSPGVRVPPPHASTTVWSPHISIPDLYWQIDDAGATGSVQVQDWPATARATLVSEVLDQSSSLLVRYRLKLQPLCGTITHWPVIFTSNQQNMMWISSPNKSGWSWKLQSPTSGRFHWLEPLSHTVEMETTLPWADTTPLPLISSPLPFEGRLRVGQFWKIPADWQGTKVENNKTDLVREWRYEGITPAPVLDRLNPRQLVLLSPTIETRINGAVAESVYSTTLPPHQNSLQLTLPDQGEFISFELNGISHGCNNPLTLPPAFQATQLKLKYRTLVHDQGWASSWRQTVPQWNVETTPPPACFVTTANQRLTLSGPESTSDKNTTPPTLTGSGLSFVWVSWQLFVFITIFVFGLCWWVSSYRFSMGIIITCSIIAILLVHSVLSQGSANTWWLAPPALLGLAFSWLRSPGRWRRQASIATFIFLALAGSGMTVVAQSDRCILVYILRGDDGKINDERVMVPASLWQQLQSMEKQTVAGATQTWWVSSVLTEGQLQGDRLRLKSKWTVSVSSTGAVDIPWPDHRPPEEVIINGNPIQPRLVSGLFGLQQWVISVLQPGTHEVTWTWEIPLRQDSAIQSAEIKFPGAPCQRLVLKGVSEKLSLQGTSGAWQIAHKDGTETISADVGFSRLLTLSWPLSKVAPPDVSVDLGVLWEHRVHQSMAHAVLDYHIEHGTQDQFKINLPAGLRVRSLSMVGDVHAAVVPRIRKWRMEQVEGKQQLQVSLHRPVSGTVHLLVELLWQRDPHGNTVPLEQLYPIGVRQRLGFVAYLADGVLVVPLTPLQPATNEEVDFARPWLPSLTSLPMSAIAKTAATPEQVVPLSLQPLPLAPLLKTENSIIIEPQGVQYRFKVEAKGQQRPFVFLNSRVDPGLVISEVAGNHLSKWHQTSARPGEPTQLSIWFHPASGSAQDTSFTVIARHSMERNEDQRIRIPVFQIKWDGTSQDTACLKLLSTRPGKVMSIQSHTMLKELPGPRINTEMLAIYEQPQSLPINTTILIQEENTQQWPSAAISWEKTQSEPRWLLTLSAPAGGMLPSQIEMLSLKGLFEQNWQFEASVPLAFRPSRSQGNAILWSIQMSKPVNKLQIKCFPLKDAQGHLVTPTVSFPAWPGVTITPAE